MKKILVVLAILAVSVGAGSDAGDRLYYVFSPDAPEQRLRLARLWRAHGAERLVVIARPGREIAGVPVLSAGAAAESPVVPEYIKARLDEDRDYYALTDRSGVVLRAGRGRALALAVPTEIDENTWGKVKDLFR